MLLSLLDKLSVTGWLAVWAIGCLALTILNYFFWEGLDEHDKKMDFENDNRQEDKA